MANWSIDYNGFGSTALDWTALDIKWRKTSPVYAGDGVTLETMLNEISGTALISGANATAFDAALTRARERLPRQNESISTDGTDNLIIKVDGVEVVSIEDGDQVPGTPQGDFTVNQIHGTLCAVVGFTIRWHEQLRITTEDTDYDVMSHWWTQTFDQNDIGLQTWTINGMIGVRQDADTTGTNPVRKGPNPDKYRNLVMPALPERFRIQSEQWGTDEKGNHLAYTIVAQEFAREIPGPGRDGSGSFSWVRSIAGGGGNALGIKTFEAELEGDWTASANVMLQQLIVVSGNRINYARDHIMSIGVTELDIFKRNRIQYRVVARAVSASEAAMDEWWKIGPGFNLLNNMMASTANYTQPDEYGALNIRAARRAMFVNTDGFTATTFPIAKTEGGESSAVDTYTFPDATFDNADAPLPQQGTQAGTVTQDHIDSQYTDVSISESVRVATGMVNLPSQSLNGGDIPYQVRKPMVELQTTYRITRHNSAAPRVFLNCPPGSIIKSETFDVQPGNLDGNNNRQVASVYTRVVQMLDLDQGNFWVTDSTTIQGFGTLTIRRWRAPADKLGMPYDPRTQANASRTLFTSAPNADGFDFTLNLSEYGC